MKKVDFIKKARRFRIMFFVCTSLMTCVATAQVKKSINTRDVKEKPSYVAQNNGREISEKGMNILDAQRDIVDISINEGKIYFKLTSEAIKKLDADSTRNYILNKKAKPFPPKSPR